jgi:hypothetical protein
MTLLCRARLWGGTQRQSIIFSALTTCFEWDYREKLKVPAKHRRVSAHEIISEDGVDWYRSSALPHGESATRVSGGPRFIPSKARLGHKNPQILDFCPQTFFIPTLSDQITPITLYYNTLTIKYPTQT